MASFKRSICFNIPLKRLVAPIVLIKEVLKLIKLLRSNQEITLFAFKMQTRSKCLLVNKTINITNVLTHFLWLNYLQNVVTLSSLNIHKSNSSRVFSQGTSTSAAAPAESLLNYWILSHFRLIGISRVQFNKSRFFINHSTTHPTFAFSSRHYSYHTVTAKLQLATECRRNWPNNLDCQP